MRVVGPTHRQAGLRRQFVCLSLLGILLIGSVSAPVSATVRRRLNVNSNPPGALVYVDNQQIGTTPCSVDFVYYGTREIRLIKPGFETLTVNQPIPTPWYEIPGLDFFSENLVPMKIRDNRTVTYNLAPQLIIPPQELIDRAHQLRQETIQYGTTVPVTAVPGPVVAPGPPVALPPVATPEPLPGINPPPVGQPIVPQPVPLSQPAPGPPAPPPGGAPLLPPGM